jgi:hypothetical protein
VNDGLHAQLFGVVQVPCELHTEEDVAGVPKQTGTVQVVPDHEGVQTQLFGAVQVPCETPEQAVKLVAGCPEQIGTPQVGPVQLEGQTQVFGPVQLPPF